MTIEVVLHFSSIICCEEATLRIHNSKKYICIRRFSILSHYYYYYTIIILLSESGTNTYTYNLDILYLLNKENYDH